MQFDVVVCGGGFAGIAAALAAAREGKKVLLLEREYMLGGLATAGLVTIYLPLCDGLGRQVSFGIAEELLRLSITYGAEDRDPRDWLEKKKGMGERDIRFMTQFNPQLFALLAEQLLLKENVTILYGALVVDVKCENGKIEKLVFHDKSGRNEVLAGSVVDATGDCDIARLAGAPTKLYRQGNILAGWYYYADRKGYHLQMLGAADIPDEERTKPEQKKEGVRRFTGLDGKELSEMVCLSHKNTLEHWLEKRKEDESIVIATLPTIPQIRMTRKLAGEYELSHREEHCFFEDSVGMVSNWKKRGPVYEVPFGTLFNRTVKNLLVAGRCTSVGETMWDVMRVIPCCAVTGQAAGTAAAMTDDLTSLDVKALQEKLKQNGVVLHEEDL